MRTSACFKFMFQQLKGWWHRSWEENGKATQRHDILRLFTSPVVVSGLERHCPAIHVVLCIFVRSPLTRPISLDQLAVGGMLGAKRTPWHTVGFKKRMATRPMSLQPKAKVMSPQYNEICIYARHDGSRFDILPPCQCECLECVFSLSWNASSIYPTYPNAG